MKSLQPTCLFVFLLISFNLFSQNDACYFGDEEILHYFGINSLALSDLDNDNDLDLIMGLGSSVYSSNTRVDTLRWFENDGNANFTKHDLRMEMGRIYNVEVGDLDGNGYDDIVATDNLADSLFIFLNNASQNFTQIKVKTSEKPQNIFIEDIDSDGDADILAHKRGYSADKMFMYRNDGAGIFTEVVLIDDVEGWRDVFAIDIDEDGDTDIFTTRAILNQQFAIYEDELAFFENDGNQNFTKTVIANKTNYNLSSINVIDLDKNQTLDIIAASGGQTQGILWFSNDGNQNFSEILIADQGPIGTSDIEIVDLNNDGFSDFLFFDGSHPHYILNDGNGNFTVKEFSEQIRYNRNVNAGDLNGDNLPDLIAYVKFNTAVILNDCSVPPIYDCTISNSCNYNPDADFDDGSCVTCDTSDATTTYACDDGNPCTQEDREIIRNCDGYVCYSCRGYYASWEVPTFERPCDDNNPCTVNDVEVVYTDGSAVCEPCQGTPDCDEAFANGNFITLPCDDGDPCTYNDEIAGFACLLDYGFEYECAYNCQGYDYTCDNGQKISQACDDGNPCTFNDMETLLACDNSVCEPCEGTFDEMLCAENGFSSDQNIIATNARSVADVYAAYIDDDEHIDALSASRGDNKIAWYKNDGTGNFTKNTVSANARGADGVHAIDMDNDGDTDVLSASAGDDKIAWYENDGMGNFTEVIISENADYARDVYAADMDNDGDMDVLSASENDNKIAWYENDGQGGFIEKIISTNASGANAVFAADIDGDGDMDALSSSGNDDKIAWYENDGTNNFVSAVNFNEKVITQNADGASDVYAADLDADGDMDVLSSSANDDKIAWYENDGQGNFIEKIISTNADGASSICVKQLDGVAGLDVLSSSADDNTIAWYKNDGQGNFTEITITTNANGARSVDAADMDGDGDLDALAATYGNHRVIWYENLSDVIISNTPIENVEMDIQIYPNPMYENLTIQFPERLLGESAQIDVVDINGKKIHIQQIVNIKNSSTAINLKTAAQGMYFLQITVDNQFFVKKIIKG